MCRTFDAVSWRTPNGWVFVAACQSCGVVATSMTDGGTALAVLTTRHETLQEKGHEHNV